MSPSENARNDDVRGKWTTRQLPNRWRLVTASLVLGLLASRESGLLVAVWEGEGAETELTESSGAFVTVN